MTGRRSRAAVPLVVCVVVAAMAAWLTAVPSTSAGFTATTGVTGNTLRTVATLWNGADAPVNDGGDVNPVEVGLKFRPKSDGEVIGVRFHKAPGSTGLHTGRLWSVDGTLLAAATYLAETPTGWQTAVFAVPVAVRAHVTYLTSTHIPDGNYGYDSGYFATTARNRPTLAAPAVGDFGCNGLYNYGPPGSFPTRCFNATNYWVDVLFRSVPGADTVPVRQQNAGVTRTDSTDPVTVSLPEPVSAGGTVLIAVTSRVPIATPAGFTLDHQRSNVASIYLFRRVSAAGQTSWPVAATVAGALAWWVAEVTGLADAPPAVAGNGQVAPVTFWSTPAVTPGAGTRLLVAVAGRATDTDFTSDDSGAFLGGFTKRVESVVPVPGGGPTVGHSVATRVVAADGVTAYQTSTTYRDSVPVALLAAYAA